MTTLLLDNPIPGLNFRGFAVGNPTTHIQDDFYYGTWKTWAARLLISRPTWRSIKAKCLNVSTYLNPPQSCQDAINIASNEMGSWFNPYDLSHPMCVSEENGSQSEAMFLMKHVSRALNIALPPLRYLPCEDLFIASYLNRRDVQLALNVVPGQISGNWSDCVTDSRWNYDYNGFYISQLPVYQRVSQLPNFTTIVYSGTADTIVPSLGASRWIFNLFTDTPTEAWHAWNVTVGQAAGYTVAWNNFRFVTASNCGHLLPWSCARQGLAIFQRLVDGKSGNNQ